MTRRIIRLRTRLLAAMLGPLLAAAAILGVTGSWLITGVVQRTNDRVLAGALGAIAETVEVERGEVTLDLPPAAFGMLENNERDNVYYRVASGPEVLTGYADLPAPDPASLSPGTVVFRDAAYRGAPVRIAETVRRLPRIKRPVVVQIAETVDNRSDLRNRLLTALFAGEAALVAAAILLLRPALGWSLRPLSLLRHAVEERTSAAAPDLSPLQTGPMPAELEPLANAFDRLLERLDAASSGIRRFTADASHQMRTPLAVLKVQVALARRGSAEALDEIHDAVNRLERLLTQLLSLARAQEEGHSAPLEAVDLREVATAVITRLIGQADAAGVELQLLPDDDRQFVVSAHRTLIFELLGNLVDNAIRYNHRGGQAVIIMDRDGPDVVLTVDDDGPGITAPDRARVFRRFVRLEPQTTPEGSGLGLAIVQSIAARLGASVVLDNSPAGGLRVRIAFSR
jgi:two-component system sensor histidine kinase TctE